MTDKQIKAAKKELPRLGSMNEEQTKLHAELSCREMINSIMIYRSINSPYNEKTGELDYYLREYAKDSGFYGIGKERVLELIREQQADFANAKVNYGETPDEEAHVEVDYTHAPYKEDYLHALDVWHEKYKDDDDMRYVPDDSIVCSTRYMKQKENN